MRATVLTGDTNELFSYVRQLVRTVSLEAIDLQFLPLVRDPKSNATNFSCGPGETITNFLTSRFHVEIDSLATIAARLMRTLWLAKDSSMKYVSD